MGSESENESPEVAAIEAGDQEHHEDQATGGFDRWRKESSIGGVGTGIARGLQAVFAPPADEIAIVAAVPGEPPDADTRLRVILDLDDPSKSVAIVPEGSSSPDKPLGRTPET